MNPEPKSQSLRAKLLAKLDSALTDKPAASANGAPIAVNAEGPSWVKYVAVVTGVLAGLAGFLTVRATTLTNNAIYESNQAILAQTQASDAWVEYQANSIKARIIETQLLPSIQMSAEDRLTLTKNDEEIRNRQPAAKSLAEEKTAARESHLIMGAKRLAEKDLLEYAGLAAQLGIALASVAALVRRRLAFAAAIVAGIAGVGITAYAFASEWLSRLAP